MWLLPLTVPLGMCAALVARGHWSNAVRAPIRWWGVLLVALFVGIAVALIPDPPGGDALLPVSLVLFLALALRNLHWSGAGVIAVGVVANLVPVVANGYMPVRAETIVQTELAGPENYGDVELGTGRRLADADARWTGFGPIIPVPLVGEMFSFGDLIVMAGLVNLGYRAFKPRAGGSRPSPRHAAGRPVPADADGAPAGGIERPGEPILLGP